MTDSRSLLETSDTLHAEVRAFARGECAASFDELALRIARFQAAHMPGFARLVAETPGALEHVERIPALPSDAFRLTRVALHPPELDAARFVTSGTTARERGTHAFRTTATYGELALAFARAQLVVGDARPAVIALAPALDDPPTSSLGFMMALFMQHFDREPPVDARALRGAARWLVRDGAVDVAELRRAATRAAQQGAPLLLLTTSFALVGLLDALAGAALPLPPGSVVMQTGGFKGRTRELDAGELRRLAAAAFELPEAAIVAEYGMTELSSQLYEGTLPGAARRGKAGVYFAPPWLRVTPVDPVSLEPCRGDEAGLARFVDLGNIDSALAIVTRDRVRRRDGGIELVGREPGAPPRGCSLAIEALLAGAGDAR